MENEKKKTGYQSPWQDQLNDTVKKILNREKFSYDVNGDALYKQYKDRYTQMGKQAMMDTMGQAATLTGGYGNSYAQNVGQQAYQGYMQQLTDKVPALYQIALDKYNNEGNTMRNNLSLMMQQDDVGYGRYRDQLADQDSAYSKLLALMTGYNYKPTAEEMAAAGMTEAQMRAILGLPDPSAVSSGGGGGKDGGTEVYKVPAETEESEGQEGPEIPTFAEVHQQAEYMRDNQKASASEINTYLNKAMQAGVITTDQRKSLKYTFGL